MVDLTAGENFFSPAEPQAHAGVPNQTTRLLDLAARAGMRLEDTLNDGFLAAGLSPAQGRALRAVAAEPGLTVGRLTARLGISKQSLAPVLKSLIRRGLVTVAATDADRRCRLLHLTEKGRNLWDAAAGGAREMLAAAAAELGPGGLRGFEAVLHLLARTVSGGTGSNRS